MTLETDDLDVNQMWPTIIGLYENESAIGAVLPVLVFVIDALNQIIDEPYERSPSLPSNALWLPVSLPQKIKIVISCLPGKMMTGALHRCGLSLASPEVMSLQPLTVPQRKSLVIAWLDKYSKVADEGVMQQLWSADQSASPLYLALALNYLVLHGSFNYFKSVGCGELLAARSVPELLQLLIKMIADATFIHGKPGKEVIKNIFCFVYCSNQGMRVENILSLLLIEQRRVEGPEAKPFVDAVAWVTLELALSQFIIPRNGRFGFSHDFVRQAIEAAYFGEGMTLAALQDKVAVNDKDQDARAALDEAHAQIKHVHSRMAAGLKIFSQGQDDDDDEYRESMKEVSYHQRKAGKYPSMFVAVRVRPLDNREKALGLETCVSIKGKKVFLSNPQAMEPKVFEYDFAFDSYSRPKSKMHASQKFVHSKCGEDIVLDVLQGINVTVLAYGQTASGK